MAFGLLGRFFGLSSRNRVRHQQRSIMIRNPFRFVGVTIEIDHRAMAYGFDQACLLIHKALHHLEAGVAHLGDS